MSLPEVLLWRELRKRPGGHKFRRQHPAGPYVLDFFCASARVAIEIDSEAHERGDRPKRDARRDAWLRERGIEVVRISASEVLRDLEQTVRHILAECALHPSTTGHASGPPPLTGEELR